MKKTVALTLDIELIDSIDKIRGYVPRSTFINKLLEKNLTFQTASELMGRDID